ncbi:MAG TPA: lamin tail domain-containing protein, partial [Bacteroides reticulotermitis]|nr:lamin tail domain-containing protein [Bacteroides reticulotermitis]
MRRKLSFIGKIACIALMTLLTACSSDDNGTQALTLQVKVLLPEGFTGNGNAGQKVTITRNGQAYTVTTDEQGVATFLGVIPDLYDIATSWEITPEQYTEMTGKEVQNENYTLSGGLLKQAIATDGVITLQTTAAVKQSLVISKVYYAGSKDLNNKNYLAGKYVEFYNNSNDVVNVSGLYFALIESEASPAYLLNDTPDYIYIKQIFRFPSTGRTEIQPGESLVVANSAINHTPFAEKEQDLTNADFEAKDTKNTNNPATPGVELIYTAYSTIPSMNLVQS